MAATPSTGASVIDGRYLASAAGIAARPAGPVEALDTRSGRAAQVRLVFLDGSWSEDELAELVARWCGLGCAEVCGVLDFGPHENGWFLVLPPSLGVPLDRWRMIRRPTPGGAARLTAQVGGLLERVAAAGFSPDALDVRDLAVGPGPTPFLDRPLLSRPPNGPPSAAAGQRALARVLRAAAGEGIAEPVQSWAAHADGEGFATLAGAVEDLLRAGDEADAAAGRSVEPDAELDALFDHAGDIDSLLPPPDRWRPLRRLGALAGILAMVAVAFALLTGDNGASAVEDPPPGVVPVTPAAPSVGTADAAERKAPGQRPARAKRHRPVRQRRTRQGRPSTPSPAAGPAPVASGSSGGGTTLAPPPSDGTPLPDPGGVTTLPPPG